MNGARKASLAVVVTLLLLFVAVLIAPARGVSTLDELEARVAALEALHGITPPATTTTTPPATTTTPPVATTTTGTPPGGSSSVGVTGCSNTEEAVDGYSDLSSQDRLADTAQGGVEVWEWATQDKRWTRYDAHRPAGGYGAAWINLCQKQPTITTAQVLQIVDRIHQRDPGITVYLSPLNYYQPGLCPKHPTNAVADHGAAIAAQLSAASQFLEVGPTLGPLGPDDVASDLCHLSDAGESQVGAQLVIFFDFGG